jgi:Xaa-Pro aminopeptidase
MVDRKEYARRRRRVMEALDDSSVLIVPTAPIQRRNRDVDYPFRPDSDFYYLTGFAEPAAVAVIAPGREQGEYIIFCRERDPLAERWLGRCAGLDEAVARYGADDAFPMSDLDDIAPGIMEGRQRVYYAMGNYLEFDHRVLGWLNVLRGRGQYAEGHAEIVSPEHIIHDMRLIKSAAELRVMRKAIAASVDAHKRAMAMCQPGVFEFQLEAEMLHTFAKNGARHSAYQTTVAGGENGCIFHYTQNDCALAKGDLVLIDGGAEYDYYAADVTRTFPVDGKFRPAQKALYNVVLRAQEAAIDAVRPGNDFNAPHRAAVAAATKGLVELGIVPGPLSRALKSGHTEALFMGPTGHWLGLDVHDVGEYKLGGEWRVFEPGMVTTVEPGLFIPVDAPKIDAKYRGIAVRIEDDILVTRGEPEVLSAALPKEPAQIERLVGSGNDGTLNG